MTISALPPAPQPTDSQADFNSKAFAMLAALSAFGTEANALAGEVAADAAAAAAVVDTVAASVSAAAASAADALDTAAAVDASLAAAVSSATAAAAASATTAQNAASAAEATAGAQQWVSGTSYTIGDTVWSPANLQTYRCSTSGLSTTDPSLDDANWTQLGGASAGGIAPSKVSITYDDHIQLSSAAVSPFVVAVNVDAGREIVISRTGDAFVYDKTTATIGSVVAYRTAGNYNQAALLIGTDKVLVVSCATSSTALELVVLSLTGTSISVGIPATVTLAGNYTGSIRLIAVGSTYVTSYYRATNIGGMFGATVSGTTVSTGSEVTIAGAVTGGVQMIGIDSAKFLATTVVSPTFTAVPVSVSGTTLTLGTSATATASATTTGDLMALASGRFIQAYLNTTCFAALISVSGTTATISTAQVSTVSSVTSMKTVVVGSAALIAALPGSNGGFNVITDSSGTASAGTELTVTLSTSANAVHTMNSQMFGLGNSQNFFKVTVNGANPLFTSIAEPVSPKLASGLTTSSTTRVITKANGSAVLIAGWNATVSIHYDGTTVTAVSPYSYGEIVGAPWQVPGTDAYWGVPITAYGGKFRFTRGSLA